MQAISFSGSLMFGLNNDVSCTLQVSDKHRESAEAFVGYGAWFGTSFFSRGRSEPAASVDSVQATWSLGYSAAITLADRSHTYPAECWYFCAGSAGTLLVEAAVAVFDDWSEGDPRARFLYRTLPRDRGTQHFALFTAGHRTRKTPLTPNGLVPRAVAQALQAYVEIAIETAEATYPTHLAGLIATVAARTTANPFAQLTDLTKSFLQIYYRIPPAAIAQEDIHRHVVAMLALLPKESGS